MQLKGVPRASPTSPPAAPLLPLGIRTPDVSDSARLLRTSTAPQLAFAAACGDEEWQQGRSSKRVARQLSLPALLPLPGAAATGGDAESGGSCHAGPGPEVFAWPVAEALPTLNPFARPSPAAVRHEADRQLFILRQLKAHVAATRQPASSCCGGGSGGARPSAAVAEEHQSPPQPGAPLARRAPAP